MGRMGDTSGGYFKIDINCEKIMNCHFLKLTGNIEDPVEAVMSVWGPL